MHVDDPPNGASATEGNRFRCNAVYCLAPVVTVVRPTLAMQAMLLIAEPVPRLQVAGTSCDMAKPAAR